MDFSPPPHPPPLLSAPDLHQLCTDGYVGLSLRPQLAARLADLLAATDAFFALPDAAKDRYKPGAPQGPPCSPASTERGYSRLPGEKEFLTLRRSLSCLPSSAGLPAAAAAVWRDVARLLHRILGDVGVHLGLPGGPAAWDAVVADSLEPGCHGPSRSPRDDPPTLLRLFRYEPGGCGAEQHRDLGLLTLCVCWGPGLQVQAAAQSPTVGSTVSSTPDSAAQPSTAQPSTSLPSTSSSTSTSTSPWIHAPTVTVMTGDTLHVLSGRRIPSAVHRVVVDDANTSRRSIVFALRATVAGDIDLAPLGLDGSVGAMALYNGIRHQRVNINTASDIRSAMRAQFCRPADAAPTPPAAAQSDQAADGHMVGVA